MGPQDHRDGSAGGHGPERTSRENKTNREMAGDPGEPEELGLRQETPAADISGCNPQSGAARFISSTRDILAPLSLM